MWLNSYITRLTSMAGQVIIILINYKANFMLIENK